MNLRSDELREKVAQTIAEVQNVPFVGRKQRRIADALMPLIAAVWSEGADYAAAEMGPSEGEFEAPGDNPYRKGDPS